MYRLHKYPRTPHLTGSRLQPGDEDLSVVSLEHLKGSRLVVEEKLDGANCRASASARTGGCCSRAAVTSSTAGRASGTSGC